MSYQALYRVYRPQRFVDIVGQETITQTLKHAIADGKSSHAYLFTGPRGTGKTSAAKIFAKAINCPNSQDGEPCNECPICQQATKGALNDVIEIDAASNNGVEEIRDIREKANYAPTQAEYKVYIIDEVHMLSQGAFNALLKTLEEPPSNVIFILATTEPHKIPLTIISRTQRFDFKRISELDMIHRMEEILHEEGVDYDKEVLDLIAQHAEGGMRDALSILDQTLSYAQDRVTIEDAMTVTGALTQELLQDYLVAVYQGESRQALTLLQTMLEEGKDPARFLDDLILFCRDLLVHQQSPGERSLMKRAQLTEEFQALSQEIDEDFLYRVIKLLNDTQHELRLSNQAPVYLEVATIRMSQAPKHQETSVSHLDSQELTALENQLAELQQQVQGLSKNQARSHGSSQGQQSTPARKASGGPVDFKPNKTMIFKILQEATHKDLDQIRSLWPDLLSVLSATKKAMVSASNPVAASPEGAVISFEYDILCQRATEDQDLQDEIKRYIEKVTGRVPHLVYLTQEQWPGIRQEFIDQMPKKSSQDVASHTMIKEMKQEQAEEEQASLDLVDQAVELFGEDIVKVKDE